MMQKLSLGPFTHEKAIMSWNKPTIIKKICWISAQISSLGVIHLWMEHKAWECCGDVSAQINETGS